MNAERHAAPAWLLIAVSGVIFVLLVVFLLTGGMGRTLTALGWSSPDPAAAGGIATPTSFLPGGTHTATSLPTLVLLAQITSSPHPTRQECPLPAGWQGLTVHPGDTLLRLSVLYNVSMERLEEVNCLSPGERLQNGETVYVPVRATPTPGPVIGTDTPALRVYQVTYLPTRLTATRTPTRTSTRVPSSATPRPPATASATASPVLTSTPTSPPDFTATPDVTSTPTSPPEPTAEPTATEQIPE